MLHFFFWLLCLKIFSHGVSCPKILRLAYFVFLFSFYKKTREKNMALDFWNTIRFIPKSFLSMGFVLMVPMKDIQGIAHGNVTNQNHLIILHKNSCQFYVVMYQLILARCVNMRLYWFREAWLYFSISTCVLCRICKKKKKTKFSIQNQSTGENFERRQRT